jgi:hypothetical protein
VNGVVKAMIATLRLLHARRPSAQPRRGARPPSYRPPSKPYAIASSVVTRRPYSHVWRAAGRIELLSLGLCAAESHRISTPVPSPLL